MSSINMNRNTDHESQLQKNFKDKSLDISLRLHLFFNELPNENQMINDYVHKFSLNYSFYNKFLDFDQIHLLTYSLILLQTDHFNKNVKVKMKRSEFLKNLKFLNLNDYILNYFYDNIIINSFKYSSSCHSSSNSNDKFYREILNDDQLLKYKLHFNLNDLQSLTFNSNYNLSNLNNLLLNSPIIKLSNYKFIILTHLSLVNLKLPYKLFNKPFLILLTQSQLLLFKNLSIYNQMKHQLLTKNEFNFKPDKILYLDDSIALFNSSINDKSFTLFYKNFEYTFTFNSNHESNLWLSLINYVSAFKYSNLRIKNNSFNFNNFKRLNQLNSNLNTLNDKLNTINSKLNDYDNELKLLNSLTPFKKSTRNSLITYFENDFKSTYLNLKVNQLKYLSIKNILLFDLNHSNNGDNSNYGNISSSNNSLSSSSYNYSTLNNDNINYNDISDINENDFDSNTSCTRRRSKSISTFYQQPLNHNRLSNTRSTTSLDACYNSNNSSPLIPNNQRYSRFY